MIVSVVGGGVVSGGVVGGGGGKGGLPWQILIPQSCEFDGETSRRRVIEFLERRMQIFHHLL